MINNVTSTLSKQRALAQIPESARVRQAGFVTRMVAFLIDIAIVSIGSLLFAALISLVLNFFGFSAQDLHLSTPMSILDIIQLIIVGVSGLAVLLFVPAYFVVFWVLVGATPGKLILGLQVNRTNGKRLGWGRAIVRFFGYWISAIVFFLGFLWVFIDVRRQGWHDKFADTYVVYTWDVPPVA